MACEAGKLYPTYTAYIAANWPLDYTEEFNRRIRLHNVLIDDDVLRDSFMLHYKYHPEDWINDWCITYDPRIKGDEPRLMPFNMFQRQLDFLQFLKSCWEDKEDGLTEKCRDIGATWLCCAFSVWLWLFWPDSAIGWGSRKEEYVDKRGDPKAIFPKIRMIIDNLPRWMWPETFDLDAHAPYMRIINPANGATITGEAGTNMGRGGRTTIYFKDESAHYENPQETEAALGDNTDVQIDISSVNGTGNVFHTRRMNGEVWYVDKPPTAGKTRVFIFDWRDHPNKTQAWYDRRRQKAMDDGLLHLFAQEVDRDYLGSVDRIVIRPEWVEAAIDAHKVLKFPGGGSMAKGEKVAGQDVADEGGDKNALAIRTGVILRFCEATGGDPGDAAEHGIPICKEYGVTEVYYDSIGVGAGFKVATNKMREHGGIPRLMLVMPWNAGSGVLDPTENIIYGDESSPLNEDQYENLKAQSWFRTRTRFIKTYRAVRHGEVYLPEELISIDSTIPRLNELKNELSQAQYKSGKSGKTLIDKAPKGMKSPNMADSVIICFNPVREISIFDVIE